jgi:cytoskeletal protein RodZ
MIVFGLILVALAVLLAAGVVASSGNQATLDVFGVGFNTRASVVFFVGVVTAIALLLGLWLTKAGLARGYRRRKEVRELRHKAKAAPAPVADLPSTRSDQADEEQTKEVAAGNDADADKAGHEEGPRHRATGSNGTPADKPEEAEGTPVGNPEHAGRAPAGRVDDAGTTPVGKSDDIWRSSAHKSEDAGNAEQKDDSLRTVPRSGTTD